MKSDALSRLVRELVRERFGDDMPAAYIGLGLVDLDRGGTRELVFRDGETAIYVPEGPAPDYLVDHDSRTILIGRTRAGREATPDEIRAAVMAGIAELFGN